MKTIKILTPSNNGRLKKPSFACMLGLAGCIALTGCSKDSDKTAIKNDEVKSAAKEVPMSAAPAKVKEAPIAVTDNTSSTVGALSVSSAAEGTIIEAAAPKNEAPVEKTAKGKNKKASAVAETNPQTEGEADNSAMDSISENDQVIDDAPASPDAPQAKEGSTKPTIQNAPVHKTK